MKTPTIKVKHLSVQAFASQFKARFPLLVTSMFSLLLRKPENSCSKSDSESITDLQESFQEVKIFWKRVYKNKRTLKKKTVIFLVPREANNMSPFYVFFFPGFVFLQAT